jgi:hypothetical protein
MALYGLNYDDLNRLRDGMYRKIYKAKGLKQQNSVIVAEQ